MLMTAHSRSAMDVVLMDLRIREISGVATTRQVRPARPTIHVLMLTTYPGDCDVVSAIEAGATGYLLKHPPREEQVRAVQTTARSEEFSCRS